MGITRSPATPDAIKHYHDAWERVSIDEEAVCDDISAATQGASKARRALAAQISSHTSLLVPPRRVALDDIRLASAPSTSTDIVMLPDNTTTTEMGTVTPYLGEACQVDALFYKAGVEKQLAADVMTDDLQLPQREPKYGATIACLAEGFLQRPRAFPVSHIAL